MLQSVMDKVRKEQKKLQRRQEAVLKRAVAELEKHLAGEREPKTLPSGEELDKRVELINKLKEDPRVRDPEALAAWIGMRIGGLRSQRG